MRRFHLPILIVLLSTIGLGIFAYKVIALDMPVMPGASAETWQVEARVRYQPTGGAANVQLRIPDRLPNFATLDENFVSRGYGLNTLRAQDDRIAQWTIRQPRGEQVLYYRATLYRDGDDRSDAEYPGPVAAPEWTEPYRSAADALIEDVRGRSSDIQTFASVLVNDLAHAAPASNAAVFADDGGDRVKRTETLIELLATARIPARTVTTLHLRDGRRDVRPETWIEVHNTRRWVPIHPLSGEIEYPDDVVVWAHGSAPLLEVSNGRDAEVRFAVSRGVQDALTTAQRFGETVNAQLMEFSTLNLPLGTQNTYRVLLMVPLGAMIIVFLRNVIGVQTFGTFMPVLIALSFRETQLLAGIILFTLIVSLGLAVRFYLEHLRLLLVPRLAAVVSVVIMLMLGISILSHQLGFERALALSLFPMVILAMTIERMSVVWEEHGPSDAITQGIGSLAVAAAAYGLMANRHLEHLLFVFPELLLVLLAMTLLLGRYTGYRLSELFRFGRMQEAMQPSKRSEDR
ncbi:inactive transglutaminase family protein [Thioalkalivibrio thiocyanoxidans]|uniref:inactive transglutaminase family protein n=1 Tax=Thioalkalivibrio thiocyanoxidans TaxID=152475 RepID=UPI0003743AE7|nr:inactive transglutaminase family protein [Thioalkalivibrio thiocyanoxidans]